MRRLGGVGGARLEGTELERAPRAALPSIALILLVCGCGGPTTVEIECPDVCGGTGDCFGDCMCRQGDQAACAARCGVPPDAAVLRSVDGWPEPWTSFAAQLVGLVNESRARGGCCADSCFAPEPPLGPSAALELAARRYALELLDANELSHVGSDGRNSFDRIRGAGFSGCAMGENLAIQLLAPAEVIEQWLESPEHCRNLLDAAFTEMGIGYAESASSALSPVWVQTFGG